MMEFIMLGIIPGTTVQLTFSDWLRAMVVILAIVAMSMLLRHTTNLQTLARRLVHRSHETTARPA